MSRLPVDLLVVYNSANDPVNAFLTLWPLGFNFTKFLLDQITTSMSDLEYALFSSTPIYNNDSTAINNFNWSLEDITNSPYNLSSTLTNGYTGWNDFTIDTASACDYSSKWVFSLVGGNFGFDNMTLPSPIINLQLDGTTANFEGVL